MRSSTDWFIWSVIVAAILLLMFGLGLWQGAYASDEDPDNWYEQPESADEPHDGYTQEELTIGKYKYLQGRDKEGRQVECQTITVGNQEFTECF